MAWSTQNVWWRNSSAPGTFSGLFPRVRAYADPKPLPQAGGVRHRYTRTPPPRHSPGWLGGTLRAGPGPLIDPHGAHAGPGPTPPIPPLGHPTRHPLLVIWLRKRRLAGHPKNVLKKAAERFDLPAPLIHWYKMFSGSWEKGVGTRRHPKCMGAMQNVWAPHKIRHFFRGVPSCGFRKRDVLLLWSRL